MPCVSIIFLWFFDDFFVKGHQWKERDARLRRAIGSWWHRRRGELCHWPSQQGMATASAFGHRPSTNNQSKQEGKKLSLDIFEHLWRQYHWEYYKLINHIFIRSYKMGIFTESKTNDFISITSWHFKHFDAKAVGTFVTPCARAVELQLAVWIGLGGINAEPKLSNWHKIVKIRNTKG